MNKLKTTDSGGMPLVLDDIRWHEAAVRDALYGIISAIGISAGDSFKLSGCQVTVVGNIYTTTAGYICLNGEVLKVEAHSVTKTGGVFNTIIWQLNVAYDASGLKIFKNGNSFDTYEIRTAVLVEAPIAAGIMSYNAKSLWDKLDDVLNAAHNSGWSSNSIIAGDYTANSGSWSIDTAQTTLRYKIIGKTMTVDIELYNSSTSSADEELYVEIPASKTIPAGKFCNATFTAFDGTDAILVIASSVTSSKIRLQKADTTAWGTVAALHIRGQISFEIE